MGADPVSWGVIAASVAGAAVGGTAATMLNKPKTPKVKDSTVLQDDEAANNVAAQKKQQRLTSSLLSTGGERGSGSGSGGKTTLGQ